MNTTWKINKHKSHRSNIWKGWKKQVGTEESLQLQNKIINSTARMMKDSTKVWKKEFISRNNLLKNVHSLLKRTPVTEEDKTSKKYSMSSMNITRKLWNKLSPLTTVKNSCGNYRKIINSLGFISTINSFPLKEKLMRKKHKRNSRSLKPTSSKLIVVSSLKKLSWTKRWKKYINTNIKKWFIFKILKKLSSSSPNSIPKILLNSSKANFLLTSSTKNNKYCNFDLI